MGVRKGLVVILARAQKAMIFSGFGLIYMNLRTFVQVRFLFGYLTMI
jgi:hypothetical protein